MYSSRCPVESKYADVRPAGLFELTGLMVGGVLTYWGRKPEPRIDQRRYFAAR